MTLRPESGRDKVTAGKRNRTVTVERFTFTTDTGSGEQVKTWAALKSAMASWRRASARETLASSEVGASVTDVFGLPWSVTFATVTPLDRLIYDNRTYDIVEATEIGLREGILVTAQARAE